MIAFTESVPNFLSNFEWSWISFWAHYCCQKWSNDKFLEIHIFLVSSRLLNHENQELKIFWREKNRFNVIFKVLSFNSAHNIFVHFHASEGVSLAHNFFLNRIYFLDSFIDEQVGILNFLFALRSTSFPSEGLIVQILEVEFSDNRVVKFEPLLLSLSFLDQWVVVTTVSIPDVNDNSFQLVFIILVGSHLFWLKSCRILLFS